ncbi:hypothetical protein DPMN_155203 [Dreissena polymorpha]|uniref:Uncharacterized protein n=1 Tax=Dreissena polymorpha TaxID=45954 RepID=A0A9D4FLV1_DREPO|nr:hypothetical protein DPMN_155203 [Dreissena polymorpha]
MPQEKILFTHSQFKVWYFQFKETAPKVDRHKLEALKIQRGPWVGELVKGRSVTLPDGRQLEPKDIILEKGQFWDL